MRKTRGFLRRFAEYLAETFGVSAAERLQARHLRQWHRHAASLRTARGRPLKASSVNRRLVAVHGLLEHMARRGHIHRRLLDELPYVKEPRLLPGSVLTHARMRALLDSVPTDTSEGFRNRTMLEVLYSTGIRAGELLGLDLGRLDFASRSALVKGKGDKERMVPLGRTACRLLEGYVAGVRPFLLAARGGDAPEDEKAVFVGKDGRRLSYAAFRRMVRSVARKARLEINVTPHTFRRSCTTELLRSGANMYHVKELLGHESLDTLKHYARLTITDLKKTHARCHPRERDERGRHEEAEEGEMHES